MKHWILRRDLIQTIIENLDRNLMTLTAAKNYFASYGVHIKGNTKQLFIRNLCKHIAKD
jgi:hypothetical protein